MGERTYVMLYEPKPAIKPGDYVRSYDFKASGWGYKDCGGQEYNADCYIEGKVVAIEPFLELSSDDRFHIKVEKVVWGGEEIPSDLEMIYPWLECALSGKNYGVQHAKE
tara:strand:+ start:132 stop:458 length:327 start_codon:yes stop_codon:yes gene_type:complete